MVDVTGVSKNALATSNENHVVVDGTHKGVDGSLVRPPCELESVPGLLPCCYVQALDGVQNSVLLVIATDYIEVAAKLATAILETPFVQLWQFDEGFGT